MTRVIGKNNNGAWANVYKRYDGGVSLTVGVQDDKIREQGVDHNGYEKAFALVPQANGEWKRYELDYAGSSFNRGVGAATDNFGVVLDGWDDDVKLDDLRQRGVAFGLEVTGHDGKSTETLWLQGYEDNYKLNG